MAFRAMSSNETLGDPATHFFKSGNALRAQSCDELGALVKKFPAHKIEYDIWYSSDDADKVHGFVYTDVANRLLYIRVADKQRCIDIMGEAAKSEITEHGEKMVAELAAGSDKYIGRTPSEQHDFVIFLPGTNIFDAIVKKDKLANAVKQGAKLKLHPLTARPIRAELASAFGSDAIIDARVSAHKLMAGACIVGAFSNSEMGLVAAAQDKRVYLFNDLDRMCTYTAVYRAIREGDKLSRNKLLRVMSSTSSGFVSPEAAPDKYMDGFFNQFEGQHV